MIIPSVFAETFDEAQQQLDEWAQLQPSPEAIQIDIIDGEFAEILTIDTRQVAKLELPDTKIDVHLMTLDPTDYIYDLVGIPGIRTVIGQVEKLHSQQEFVEEAEASRLDAGLSLDLYTAVEALEEKWLGELSVVQVMGARAGLQGQEFRPVVLEKIEELAELRRQLAYKFKIFVDIGMNPATILLAKKAGADSFIIGSALQTADQQQEWDSLREAEE